MKLTNPHSSVLALALLSLLLASATGRAQSVTPTPLMTSPGAVLASDTFAEALPKAWRPGKGKWSIEGGAVRGLEVAADKHQAVMRRPLAFTNAVITFSFRLGQARQISLSINDAKEHVCRLVINPRGFTVQKDDHDHDGPDKAVVFARVAMMLAPGEWHTAVVELNGPEMVAQIDSKQKVGFGAHELLDRPKANIGFTVAGGPAEFRNVSVVAAQPRADWADTKKRLATK